MSSFVTVWATSKGGGQPNQRERASDLRKRAFDHLGIVAGGCQERELAQDLDAQAAGLQRHVRIGTAPLAMMLNG